MLLLPSTFASFYALHIISPLIIIISLSAVCDSVSSWHWVQFIKGKKEQLCSFWRAQKGVNSFGLPTWIQLAMHPSEFKMSVLSLFSCPPWTSFLKLHVVVSPGVFVLIVKQLKCISFTGALLATLLLLVSQSYDQILQQSFRIKQVASLCLLPTLIGEMYVCYYQMYVTTQAFKHLPDCLDILSVFTTSLQLVTFPIHIFFLMDPLKYITRFFLKKCPSNTLSSVWKKGGGRTYRH